MGQIAYQFALKDVIMVDVLLLINVNANQDSEEPRVQNVRLYQRIS